MISLRGQTLQPTYAKRLSFGMTMAWQEFTADELERADRTQGTKRTLQVFQYLQQLFSALQEVTYDPKEKTLHLTGSDGQQVQLRLETPPQNPEQFVEAIKAQKSAILKTDLLGIRLMDPDTQELPNHIDHFSFPPGWDR